MINTMKSVGLPRPTFKVDIARVTVILQRFGLADGEVASWVKERLGDEFSIAEGAALVLAKDLGPSQLKISNGRQAATVVSFGLCSISLLNKVR